MKKRCFRLFAGLLALAVMMTYTVIWNPSQAKTTKSKDVKKVEVTNVQGKNITLGKGKKLKLSVNVVLKKESKASKAVKFKSSKKSVVTVSKKGVLKAKKIGKAKITVKSKANPAKQVKFTVTVAKKNVLIKKISMKKKLTLHMPLVEEEDDSDDDSDDDTEDSDDEDDEDEDDEDEEDYEFEPRISPSNATNQTLKWTSSNEIALSGATDKLGNALAASYSLKKEKSYVASYDFVSTGFASGTATAKINYTAKDQYGEDKTATTQADATVSVSATLGANAMPLGAEKADDGVVTITNIANYTEGQEIKVVLTTKVDDVVKATAEKTLVAGKAAVAKSIAAVSYTDAATTNVEAKAVLATSLTADVRDQYNNKMTTVDLTWKSSDASVVSFATPTATPTTTPTATPTTTPTATSFSNTISVYGLKEGNATISAYLPDGTVCGTPLKVVVKAGEVNSISCACATDFNSISKAAGTTVAINPAKKEGKYIVVTDKNGAEIKLKASDVTFEVASDDASQSTWKNGFVTVTPVSDADGYLTAFTVAAKLTGRDSSAKDQTAGAVGRYTIKVNAKKADGSKVTADITTYAKYDENVASISFDSTASVVAGGTIRNGITFKNQYGECVPVKEKDITVAYAKEDGKFNVTLSKYDYSTKAEDEDYVGSVVVKATSDLYQAASVGNHEVTFVVGTKTATLNVSVTAAPALKAISLGTNKVDLISGNTLDKGIGSEDVVGGYTLVPVTFTDSNGQAGVVKVISGGKIAMVSNESQYYSMKPVDIVKNSGADTTKLSVKYFDKDKKECASFGNEVKYIGFNNTVDTTATSKIQLQYVYEYNADVKVSTNEFTVNTEKARALKDLSVKGNVTTAVVGQNIDLTFDGVDQYGEKIDLPGETTMVDADHVTYTSSMNSTISADKAGKYTVTFKNGTISQTYSFTVIDETAVDKIVIQPTVKSGEDSYDSANYLVKVANNAIITPSVKAYAGGVEVAIDQGAIDYTFDSKAADDKSGLAVNKENGTVTAAGDGSVKISATQKFSTATIASVTVKVSDKDAVATTNTSFATKNDNGVYTNVANVSVKKGTSTEKGTATVYLHATDQYGKDFIYSVTNDNVVLIGKPAGAEATVDGDTHEIKITSAQASTSAAGTATLRVVLGTDVYDVPVTIA